jgi:hypothetical protein
MVEQEAGRSWPRGRDWVAPFLLGAVAAAASFVVLQATTARRRRFDPGLVRRRGRHAASAPTVVVPGILGSSLHRPDGTQVWLNLGNAFGTHELPSPLAVRGEAGNDLAPGGLLGVDAVLPRLFGFTEYADLLDLLARGGYVRDRRSAAAEAFHVFTYDWRRDLVDGARRLHDRLEALADAFHDPRVRFDVIGHSMGGLVARYYLRYGTAAPGGPVTWAGASRLRNLVLVGTPNAGGVGALDVILNGSRVGFSNATLAARVVRGMPSIYQLLPAPGTGSLVDAGGEPVDADVLDPETWRRFGWGPYALRAGNGPDQGEAARDLLARALAGARAFWQAMCRPAETPCPVPVWLLGGDCLPTVGRALVDERGAPRFEPRNRREAAIVFEAGDGRVTRASALAEHLPGAEESPLGSGLPEIAYWFFGAADHHGIYAEPTFQSVLLRILRRPARLGTTGPPGRLERAERAAIESTP